MRLAAEPLKLSAKHSNVSKKQKERRKKHAATYDTFNDY